MSRTYKIVLVTSHGTYRHSNITSFGNMERTFFEFSSPTERHMVKVSTIDKVLIEETTNENKPEKVVSPA
jgi:hypothetical protein